jgi:hypothetical protein
LPEHFPVRNNDFAKAKDHGAQEQPKATYGIAMVQRHTEFPSDLNEPPAQGRRLLPYVAAWAVLAAIAATYLILVSVRPGFLDNYLPVANAELAEITSQNEAAIVNMRDSVGQLQTDVARVQADVAEQNERERKLAERVAALENAGAGPAATGTSASEAAPRPQSELRPSSNSGDQPRVLNSAIETGSVADEAGAPAAKPKATAAPAAATAAAKPPKPVGIRLATGHTVDNLRASWSILTERHAGELGSLEPRYSSSTDDSGTTYRLVAGPVKSTAEAKKLCKALQDQAIACSVGDFGGKPL